ncbi:MAG: TIGR04282 family arsenosugar biosynthesis glycosyltransferase [Vulcanimicrobiaceae bacterium]
MLAKVPTAGAVKTRLVPPLQASEAAALALAFAADLAARVGVLAPRLGATAFLYYAASCERVRDDATDAHDTHEARDARDARDDVFDRTGAGGPGSLTRISGTLELRPQAAGDLGARMRAIVVELQARGFAHVVLIGADMPTLPDDRIERAFAALAGGASVAIARAKDGGYVLLGIDAPYDALFGEIPWGTAGVYESTLARARAAGLAPCELPEWYDVDTARDLARLRDECAGAAASLAPRTARLLATLRF